MANDLADGPEVFRLIAIGRLVPGKGSSISFG